MKCCICLAVIEPRTLGSTVGSTNRSVRQSDRQPKVTPLCRSATRDIAALQTAFVILLEEAKGLYHVSFCIVQVCIKVTDGDISKKEQ